MHLKIGHVQLGARPVVCAVLQKAPSPAILKSLTHSGVRLVELRIDRLNTNVPAIKKMVSLLKKKKFSVLATIRSKEENGGWRKSESERVKLFKEVIPFVDAVDIELQSKISSQIVKLAHAKKKIVIVSFHHFKKTPALPQLSNYLKRAKSLRADIVKIAAFAKSKKDYYALMEFTLVNRNHHLITISMGKAGQSSRVLFPLLGSLVTFGYVGRESAPGQLPVEKLAKAFQLHCC